MRRQLTAAVFFFVAASTAAVAANDFPYGRTLAFTVYRNGKEIGHHTVSFQQEGAKRVVNVAVELTVKALGVTAYRYVHNSQEIWNAGTFQGLDSRTDDNGMKYVVRVRRDPNGLIVDRQVTPPLVSASANDQGLQQQESGRDLQPASMLPTSNWNFGQIGQSVLLNTQYGTPSHTKITPMGREPIKTASGATIEATRYRYTGDLRMDQWFDDRGRWVRATFPAFDGSTIDYILQE
jgi:uncharacterized protein DUF6134